MTNELHASWGKVYPFDFSFFSFHADIWAWAIMPPLMLYAAGAVLFWAARALWSDDR